MTAQTTMTIESSQGSSPAALARVGDEIARDALVATGALFVHVASFDPATGLLRTAASAGLRLGPPIVGRRRGPSRRGVRGPGAPAPRQPVTPPGHPARQT